MGEVMGDASGGVALDHLLNGLCGLEASEWCLHSTMTISFEGAKLDIHQPFLFEDSRGTRRRIDPAVVEEAVSLVSLRWSEVQEVVVMQPPDALTIRLTGGAALVLPRLQSAWQLATQGWIIAAGPPGLTVRAGGANDV